MRKKRSSGKKNKNVAVDIPKSGGKFARFSGDRLRSFNNPKIYCMHSHVCANVTWEPNNLRRLVSEFPGHGAADLVSVTHVSTTSTGRSCWFFCCNEVTVEN